MALIASGLATILPIAIAALASLWLATEGLLDGPRLMFILLLA